MTDAERDCFLATLSGSMLAICGNNERSGPQLLTEFRALLRTLVDLLENSDTLERIIAAPKVSKAAPS
jgi:hypothetical protein